MANFLGSDPAEIKRMLGFVDQDDPTNLPLGCAALAKNKRFTLTSADTRFGYQTTMQGKNKAPITGLLGLLYTPESATESFFQSPTIFDYAGSLQYELPVGTGRMNPLISPIFTPATRAHMIGAQAYNRAWMSFSDLIQPQSLCGVRDLATNKLWPYGMKPFGGAFLANTAYLVGEMVTPTATGGNGHTYRVTVAGETAAEPVWPTIENATVTSGGVTFEEYTAVMANRIPSPLGAELSVDHGHGTFPAGLDVYIQVSYVNGVGETLVSARLAFLSNTVLNDAIRVFAPGLGAPLPGWVATLQAPYLPTGVNIYEVSVAHGSPEPPITAYQFYANVPLSSTTLVTHDATSGIAPPVINSARITGGMLPTPTVSPVLTRATTAGTFPAGRDVYVLQTYLNATGETLPGPASSILDTLLDDQIQAAVSALEGYPQITQINVYEADVPTGTAAPDTTQFALVGTFAPGDTADISAPASGPPPPLTNTTGNAGNIVADTPTGGINGSQGQRYLVIAYENVLGSISGIVQAAVSSYVVDEDGWELGVFNVAVGPVNIGRRILGFTVADGTSAGAFGYLSSTLSSDGAVQTTTIIPDNVSSSLTVNFTDQSLLAAIAAGSDLTSRLQTIWPNPCVDFYYSASLDRMCQTGVPGFYSGHAFSQAADPETYQGDTCFIVVGSDDGERAMCVRDFRGTTYSLRERSGFVIGPSTATPNTWSVTQRWSKVGPCGPRAVDVSGEFMLFVHRSGIYKYEDAFPENVSKEIPRFWNTINWKAAETIWVYIDVEEHEVRIGLPVGGSMVPNCMLVLNYEEGWANPLLFSRYSGNEITIEAARKYSVHDGQFFLGARIERELPNAPVLVEGPVNTTEETQRFRVTQMLLCSSGPDGTVQAVTPGVYNDNGAGIDDQYETTCPQKMMAVVQLRGFNLNAIGNGTHFPSFLAAREMVTDFGLDTESKGKEVKLQPFDLSPNQSVGISRQAPPVSNERWRLRITNGCVPDAWSSLKYACLFSRAIRTGRNEGGG